MKRTQNTRWKSALRGQLWWLLAGPVLLVAAYVVIARQLLLLVPDYRTDLEALVEEQLGVPVSIEQLSGHLDGLVPRLQMEGLTLDDAGDDTALRLDRVAVSVKVLPTLWHRQAHLRELSIQGVDVHLVRDPDGSLRLRGLENLQREQGVDDLASTLRTLYRHDRIVVEDARFSLDWPGLPPLAASSLTLALENQAGEHRLAVRVGARDRPFAVDARLQVQGDPLRWEELNARGYLDVEGERLQEWLPEERDWPLDLLALDGRVRAWGGIERGDVRSAQVRLAAPHTRLTDGDQEWAVTDLNLDALFTGDPDGEGRLSVTSLNGHTPAGAVAPGPMALDWRWRDDKRHWRLFGEDLAIHALTRQLVQWPFLVPEGLGRVRDQLRTFQPRGVLQRLYLTGVDGRVEGLQGRFAGLASDADDRIPGVQGLNGWLAGTPQGGVARLRGNPLELDLPRLYDHPLSAGFSGTLRWRSGGEQWRVETGVLMAANADVRGVAMMRLDGGEALAVPELRLLADLRDGDGARASHYIPLERLPDNLSDWLGQAFRGGQLRLGQLLYQGPVKIDPQRQQDRTFQMRYQGRDLSLSFLPDWPPITGLDADVLIDGREVSGQARRGRFLNSDLSGVSVDLPPVADPALSHLVVQGRAAGPADDLDRLFRDTPLERQLPEALTAWRFGEGDVQGHLLLDIPLGREADPTTVIVDGRGDGVSLSNRDRDLTLTGVTGPVNFHSRDGINMSSLRGEALGGTFEGAWVTRGPDSQLQLTGEAPVASVRDWLGLDWLPVAGTVPLELDIGVPWQGSAFRLEARSTLEGVSVDAPSPLAKEKEERRTTRLVYNTGGQRPLVTVGYGGVGEGRFRLGDPLAGTVRLGGGSPPAMPDRGVTIEGRAGRVVAADWLRFLRDPSAAGANGGDDGDQSALAGADLIHRVSVTVDELDVLGQTLEDARFSATPDDGRWALALNSGPVAGNVAIPRDYDPRGDRPLLVNVSRLRLPGGALGDETGDERRPLAPLDVPVLDADVRGLRLGDEDLGSWSAQVRPIDDGVDFKALRGQWRGLAVDGDLSWTGTAGRQRSHYRGTVRSEDLGAAFNAWGIPPMVESEDALGRLNLAWNDWPLAPDYQGLSGFAELDIGECRIPDPERRTSVLRVLGVLNVANLQRRLRLDFSDLYDEGLVCDGIKGRFDFDGPQVTTTDLEISSPSAAFLVNGDLNLGEQTLDQRVEMTLPLSSNLYAGCLAGPAVCAGIFVVERIWGDKLDKTTSMTYRVSGPWRDPQVQETESFLE